MSVCFLFLTVFFLCLVRPSLQVELERQFCSQVLRTPKLSSASTPRDYRVFDLAVQRIPLPPWKSRLWPKCHACSIAWVDSFREPYIRQNCRSCGGDRFE